MLEYKCPRCNYTTTRKSNIKSHFNRKKICDAICENISIQECITRILYPKNLQSDKTEKLSKIYTQNIHKIKQTYTQNIHKKVPEKLNIPQNIEGELRKEKYICDYCNTEFSSYYSKWRHAARFCKLKDKENPTLYPRK